jgi:hypothetical protein
LEILWNETVVSQFEVIIQNLPGDTEENHNKFKILSAPAEAEIDLSRIKFGSATALTDLLCCSHVTSTLHEALI